MTIMLPKLAAAPERVFRPGTLNPHTTAECVARLRELPDEPLARHTRIKMTEGWLEELWRALEAGQ